MISRKTVAVGLITGTLLAGCGEKAPSSQPQKPEAPTTQLPPAGKKKLGAEAISGCDLKKAKTELRQRVIDQKPFKAGKLTDSTRGPISTYIGNKEVTIARPLVLECDSETVAYVGLSGALKARSNNTYSPIRMILATSRDSELYADLPESEDKLDVATVTFSFDRQANEQNGSENVSAFTDKDNEPYGSAMDVPFGGVLPIDPNAQRQETVPSA